MGRLEGRREGISIGESRGISIGEHIGRKESAAFTLRDLLEARFGELPEEVASGIAGLDDVQKLRDLTRSILYIESLEAFLEELKKTCRATAGRAA